MGAIPALACFSLVSSLLPHYFLNFEAEMDRLVLLRRARRQCLSIVFTTW